MRSASLTAHIAVDDTLSGGEAAVTAVTTSGDERTWRAISEDVLQQLSSCPRLPTHKSFVGIPSLREVLSEPGGDSRRNQVA